MSCLIGYAEYYCGALILNILTKENLLKYFDSYLLPETKGSVTLENIRNCHDAEREKLLEEIASPITGGSSEKISAIDVILSFLPKLNVHFLGVVFGILLCSLLFGYLLSALMHFFVRLIFILSEDKQIFEMK